MHRNGYTFYEAYSMICTYCSIWACKTFASDSKSFFGLILLRIESYIIHLVVKFLEVSELVFIYTQMTLNIASLELI